MKKTRYNISVKPGTTKSNATGGWRAMKPVIDHEVCIGCGTCDHVCPEGVCFPTGKKNANGREYYERDLLYCKGCGLCAIECPVKAIAMMSDFK